MTIQLEVGAFGGNQHHCEQNYSNFNPVFNARQVSFDRHCYLKELPEDKEDQEGGEDNLEDGLAGDEKQDEDRQEDNLHPVGDEDPGQAETATFFDARRISDHLVPLVVLQVVDPVLQDEETHRGGEENVEAVPQKVTHFCLSGCFCSLGSFCFCACSKMSKDVPCKAEDKEDVEPEIAIEIPGGG